MENAETSHKKKIKIIVKITRKTIINELSISYIN